MSVSFPVSFHDEDTVTADPCSRCVAAAQPPEVHRGCDLPRRSAASKQIQPERLGEMRPTRHRRTHIPRAGTRDLHRRGAGVQPGGAARHGAPVPAAGLVQDAAAEADHPGGGLPEPHHHQPLLLRTVQLLLHPAARLPGRHRVRVLLRLQTQDLQHRHVHALLSGTNAEHQEETGAARQAVPLHDHRHGLDGNALQWETSCFCTMRKE